MLKLMLKISVSALVFSTGKAELIGQNGLRVGGDAYVFKDQSENGGSNGNEGYQLGSRRLPSWTQDFWNKFNTLKSPPTHRPTSSPTQGPPVLETPSPSAKPSSSQPPTLSPSGPPSTSSKPSIKPTQGPPVLETPSPSAKPSLSQLPTSSPSEPPSTSSKPSIQPTQGPTVHETPNPSSSQLPTLSPSGPPSTSSKPSIQPTQGPSVIGTPNPASSQPPTPSPTGPSASPKPSTSLTPTAFPRNLCPDRADAFRTCYARAADPSNDLEQDEVQSDITPYADTKTEKLVSGSIHTSLILENATAVVSCQDMIEMETVTLQFLKNSVGSPDTFFPVCVYNEEVASFEEIVDEGSGKTVLTVAFLLKLTYVFKSEYLEEIEEEEEVEEEELEEFFMFMEQINGRSLRKAKCTGELKTECCSGKAVDHECDSRDECKKSKCCTNNGKCKPKHIIPPPPDPNESAAIFEGAEFAQVARENTKFQSMAALAVVSGTDTADVASCSVNRFTIEEFETPSFSCDIFQAHNCIINEGVTYEEHQLRCLPSAPSSAPSISGHPTKSSMPSEVPSVSSKPSISLAPSVVPTLSLAPSTSFTPTFSSRPSLSPSKSNSPTEECYPIVVNILHDNYPLETSWSFSEIGYDPLFERQSTSDDYGSYFTKRLGCFNDGVFEFVIRDTYGDGICCTHGTGGFNITTSNGLLLGEGGEFRREATVNISLPLTEMPSMAPTQSFVPSMRPSISEAPSLSISPTDSCTSIEIEVLHDTWPEETYWALYRKSGLVYDDLVAERNSTQNENSTLISTHLCLAKGFYKFEIEDTYGDGICCSEGYGYYQVKVTDGMLFGQGGPFGYEDSVFFELPIPEMPTSLPSRSLEPSISASPSMRPSISSSPTVTCSVIFIDIFHDDYGDETEWSLTDISNDEVVANRTSTSDDNNKLVSMRLCLPPSKYELVIEDDAYDGICCDYGIGYYYLVSEFGLLIANGGEFGHKETVLFEVPLTTETCWVIFVDVLHDGYGEETEWSLIDISNDEVVAYRNSTSDDSDSLVSARLCLIESTYNFTIADDYGDGICCGAGEGYYEIKTEDGLVIARGGEFDDEDSVSFVIPYVDKPSSSPSTSVSPSFSPTFRPSDSPSLSGSPTGSNLPTRSASPSDSPSSRPSDSTAPSKSSSPSVSQSPTFEDVNKLYIWGRMLSIGFEAEYTTPVDAELLVSDASAGNRYSIIVLSDGTARSAGYIQSNYNGHLGVTEVTEGRNSFQDISTVYDAEAGTNVEAPPFKKVFAGIIHSVFLDIHGQVWTTGSNYFGQLCLGDNQNRMIPSKVLINGHIVGAAVGRFHTLLLHENGTVFGCGFNAWGQIGLGSDIQSISIPTEIEGLGFVEGVSAGSWHSLFLSSDGLYATGYDFGDGRLCFFADSVIRSPTPVPDINRDEVDSFEATYESSYVLLKNGTVIGCGLNQDGQLGDGTNSNKYRTTALTTNPIKHLGYGPNAQFAFFIDDEGHLTGTGRNIYGQLGIGHTSSVNIPTQVQFGDDVVVEHISMGSDHTLAIVRNQPV